MKWYTSTYMITVTASLYFVVSPEEMFDDLIAQLTEIIKVSTVQY